MRAVSFTSGKGGVGKTTLLANIAVRLAQMDRKVLILDGDLGLANVDIMFGVKPHGRLQDVLDGRCDFESILVEAAKNITLIPGGSGVTELVNLNAFQRRALVDATKDLQYRYDYLFIDTPTGIGETMLYLNSCADEVMVIVTPEPASFADAYATIKVLSQKYRIKNFQIITNMVTREEDGLLLFRRFQEFTLKFLDVRLSFAGAVPMDSILRAATINQRLVYRQHSHSQSASFINELAYEIESARVSGRSQPRNFFGEVGGLA
jgi:flagellar biosynthesis protein FlhG